MSTDYSELLARATSIADHALRLPASQRLAFLSSRCSDDENLLRVCLGLLDLSAEDDIDFSGRVIGNYDVHSEIGRGGFGKVYSATRREPRSKVAIKFLKPGGSGYAESSLQRFQQEERILALLDHENIVTFFDHGQTEEGWPFFVMQHVEGVNLAEYCTRNGLSIDQRLRLFLQVLSAVEHAHRLVIHRDLKPSNVIITADGRAKVLDFGVAKIQFPGVGDIGEEDRARPQPNTELYASPEQLRREYVTVASDIYQLGVMLFELLAGRGPFARESLSDEQFRQTVCFETPPLPSAVATADSARSCGLSSVSRLRKRLQGDLDSIILKAIRKQPVQRYQSATAMADDIQRYLDVEPVRARNGGWLYDSGKFLQRNWLSVSLLSVLVIFLVVGAGQIWMSRQALARQNAAIEEKNASLFQIIETLKHKAKDVQEEMEQTVDRRLREYAALYEELGDALAQNDELQFARELFEHARALREKAGDTLEVRRIDARLERMPKSRSAGPEILPQPEALMGRNAVEGARAQLAIAELQVIADDLEGARQSYEDVVHLLEPFLSNKEAAELVSRSRSSLSNLEGRAR
jgi:serine/threonine protein kinase